MRLIALLLLFAVTLPVAAGQRFEVLCYHDVRDDVDGDLDADPIAVSTAHLTRHFAWLREHGYRPVSLDALLAAQAGGKPLPEKAVLLTFDDGYASFYTRIYPLLKLFNYPAVYALVGSWLEAGPNDKVPYGDELLPRSRFLIEAQIREMAASGLVEFASHSYDLHQGILGNPQGNKLPAAVTREYNAATGSYEDEATWRRRVAADLERNSQVIEKLTGRKPRAMIWPYGRYNAAALDLARDAGMPVTFSLDEVAGDTADLRRVGRHLVEANPAEGGLVQMLRGDLPRVMQRVVHLDLDYLYDPDPAQQARNLDRLLERIKAMQASTVYLQAFADPDGDGTADALYFPNRHLPVRADLFARVAWQLRTRANVRVYAWMPVLAFELPDRALQERLRVRTGEGLDDRPGVYRRLSPFEPQARQIIREIYADLAAHAVFDGLLFHDDAMLSDEEDTGEAARRVYRERWGLPGDSAAIRADPALAERWASEKSRWLNAFTLELAGEVRAWRPTIQTARNLYASVLLDPRSEAWLGQNFEGFLAAYDYVAVMAMPYMEQAADPQAWLTELLQRVAALPGALDKTVFELQSRDWRSDRPLPAATLARHVRLLLDGGLRHVGYYPDDFLAGVPALEFVRPLMSSGDYPYKR